MELKTKDITKIKFNNNRFSLTNGQIFLLGILEENAIKDQPVFLAQDESSEKVLFNPLFTLLKANNQLLSPKFHKPSSHLQSYHLEEDVLYRSTTYVIDNVKIKIESERFIDHEEMVICSQYKFKTNGKLTIDLYHGIDDTKIVSKHGVKALKSKIHEMSLKTEDNEYMAIIYNKNFRHINRNESNQPTEHYTIETEPNRTYTITKVIGYGPRIRRLKKLIKYKLNQTYKKSKDKHINFRKVQLINNKINIVNNKKLDVLLTYVYRQYLNGFSIAFSLNQTGIEEYTQMFFYLMNYPEMAKHKLMNQITRLKQYKKDAKQLGYEGAIIINSLDDFNAGNRVISKGALLVYMIDLYGKITNDHTLVDEGVLELAIEVCQFYLSYGEYNVKENLIDFNNVSNLNNSLTHINNHTLTNYLIRNAVNITKSLIKLNKKSKIMGKYSKTDLRDLVKKLNELNRKIYIIQAKDNHLIYPYQHFLIDKKRDSLDKKEENLNIFFDQFFLFMLFSQDFDSRLINNNIEYFSDLTQEINLNELLLNLVSSDIIKDEDFTRFMDGVSIDKESLMVNSHGIDYGVMGLIYIFVTHRLSGLRYHQHNFTVDSLLPKDIRRIEYEIKYREYVGAIKIKRNSARLDWKY